MPDLSAFCGRMVLVVLALVCFVAYLTCMELGKGYARQIPGARRSAGKNQWEDLLGNGANLCGCRGSLFCFLWTEEDGRETPSGLRDSFVCNADDKEPVGNLA